MEDQEVCQSIYVEQASKILDIELWDVTEENNPKKKYRSAYFVCEDLFENRGLSIGDEIELYWDTDLQNFKFRLTIRDNLVL